MIWLFKCGTKNCENNINPVNLCDPTNPVLCSLCHKLSDATETKEPCPVAD